MTTTNPQSDTLTEFETLLGGAHLPVKYLPGTKLPDEVVLVRDLPISELPKYGATLEDEEAMCELFCAKPKGWARTLTRESVAAVVEAGEARNNPFFLPWLHRRMQRAHNLQPQLGDQLREVVTAAIQQALQAKELG